MRDYVKSHTTGKRMIMGTEHPVESYVEKQMKFGKPQWVLYKSCCNGTYEGYEIFKTKKAAVEALSDYTGIQD